MALPAERLRALEEALELVVALRRSVQASEVVQRDLDALLALPKDALPLAQERQPAFAPERYGKEQKEAQKQAAVANVPTTADVAGPVVDWGGPVSSQPSTDPLTRTDYQRSREPMGTVTKEAMPTSETARGLGSRFVSWIQIMFGRLKDWRRVATRYDRCPTVFLSAVALAATVMFWL